MPKVLLIQENTATGGVSRISEHLTQGLHTHGWVTHSISLRQGRLALRLIQAWTQAKQHDVLLATHNFLPAYAAWVLSALTGKPWLMWVHGPIIPVLAFAQASTSKQRFLRWFYRRVPHVVFASHAARHSFEAFAQPLPPSQHRHVIHNASSIQPPSCLAQPSSAHPIRIGFVGRLSEEKQALQLLALLDHLPAHYQLHVIGDGPLMADMRQQGKPHLALGRLHLHGHQRVDASTYVGWQATVLCSAYEGYPMTALESLSCKVPCVSTPIAAMQEMLATHAPYMLASNASPQALAKAIEATLATPPEQRHQDMDALVQQHTPEQFARLWDQVLQQPLARERKPEDAA